MHNQITLIFGLSLCGLAACSGGSSAGGDAEVGSLRAAIELSDFHGVTGVRIDVVAAEQGCESVPLQSQIAAPESEALPSSLAQSGEHAFADGLFVLPAGSYRVCATPLAGDVPSAECAGTEAMVEIASGLTAEVVLISQCANPSNGAVDVVVALNDAPTIAQVTLDPSPFISVCESVSATVTANDPNGDDLTYAWSIAAGPEGGRLHASNENAVFSGPAGDYTLALQVDDGHGGSAKLQFPIHVTDAVCSLPDSLQSLIGERCSPCHTERAAGGLGMASAQQSYANLVGMPSHAAACSARTLVVPGDPASSYVIAKLRGALDICGVAMPRNAPPLPETEIEAFETWIESLPH